MELQKVSTKIEIQVYDVLDEKTAIQARHDVSMLRSEIRRIETEKLRITAPLREQVSGFNSQIKKITDGLQKVLDTLVTSGNAYLRKQRELKEKAEKIEQERLAEIQTKKTGDAISDALSLADSISEKPAEIITTQIKTRKDKILVFDPVTLKKWLATNASGYLTIDESRVKMDLALLTGCPAEIKEVDVL
jgi:hypothetical protein